MTTLGGACLATSSLATAVAGLGGSVLTGFGASPWLSEVSLLGDGAMLTSISVLLLYPALYGASILAELWVPSGVTRWLGRRVRGSWCMIWSTLLAGLLCLRALSSGSAELGVLASIFALGGLGVRWASRREDPRVEPLSRVLPAGMFALSCALLTGAVVWSGIPVPVAPGVLGALMCLGALGLCVGSGQDLRHQHRSAPRSIISKEGLHQALRMP